MYVTKYEKNLTKNSLSFACREVWAYYQLQCTFGYYFFFWWGGKLNVVLGGNFCENGPVNGIPDG